MNRRRFLGLALAALPARAASPLVDTHVHLFDPARFPYASDAPYKPAAATLESYVKLVRQAGIAHTVIVHPEPYQDDHRYLEYCFAHEPAPGFFKGTCLFDPVAAETPSRMEALVRKHPGRIVALRIHEIHAAGTPSLTTGPIKDRDLHSPAMLATWRKAHSLGLAIQMHFIPYYAPAIGELAAQIPEMPVILDHLGRAGQGSPAEFDNVLKLARYPRVYMKYSGPYQNRKDVVRRSFDAFGPERMLWGGLGMTMPEFEKQSQLFDAMFDFASASQRAQIRGLNAIKLFQW